VFVDSYMWRANRHPPFGPAPKGRKDMSHTVYHSVQFALNKGTLDKDDPVVVCFIMRRDGRKTGVSLLAAMCRPLTIKKAVETAAVLSRSHPRDESLNAMTLPSEGQDPRSRTGGSHYTGCP